MKPQIRAKSKLAVNLLFQPARPISALEFDALQDGLYSAAASARVRIGQISHGADWVRLAIINYPPELSVSTMIGLLKRVSSRAARQVATGKTGSYWLAASFAFSAQPEGELPIGLKELLDRRSSAN